jgi:hypothetical protein
MDSRFVSHATAQPDPNTRVPGESARLRVSALLDGSPDTVPQCEKLAATNDESCIHAKLLDSVPIAFENDICCTQGMERWRMTFSSWSTSDQVTTTLGVPLNPIDVKSIDFLAPVSSSLGCDFAGVVSSISSEATGTWKLGDHLAGFVQGGLTSEYGSFAEYVKAESDLVWKIPDSISDENAATWGVSGVTAMMALNHHLGVPWLDSNGRPRQEQAQNTSTGSNDEFSHILIYAGSTSVGLFAIQLAKAAGLTVITTCSPHSFDLVRSYGADAVFDYRSSTAAEEIKTSYPNIIRALDSISEGPSTDFCARVFSKKGG